MSHSYDHALRDLVEVVGNVYDLTDAEQCALSDRLRPIIVEAVEASSAVTVGDILDENWERRCPPDVHPLDWAEDR